ncbi:hypothetical protein [Mycobacterium sp. URHB0044]|jgi:hypothetical protein|uniref:hypothetical protein n=1 Tax=Mycobacterium sp. URHB0044 TaxID=1380386 RepID=UPI00048FA90C|nr:hypothetical protein [Mycobacterium sp. URHB0044]
MKKNGFRGPLVTLAAVAALGGGLWWMNVSQETDDVQATTTAQSTTAPTSIAAPAPPSPSTTPPMAFPAKADYVGKVPTAAGAITLEIAVNGPKAVAYACDGNTVEVWLRGSATDGALSLASKNASSRLEGRLQGATVVGTLWIGDKKWDFTAAPAEPPAGLYVYEDAGVRDSWIVDGSGGVTGVRRRADGATEPAPALSIDGTTVVDGRKVTAIRVEGDDVI